MLVVIHALCILICGAFASGSYWLAKLPNEISQADVNFPLTIEEAGRLVASSAMWNEELIREKSLDASLAADAVNAVSWVPPEFDWQHSMEEIQALAAACNLILIEIRPGEEFDGSRIAIHTAVCQLEGSYESVCQFLDGLTKFEYPIWASELTMENNTDGGPLTVVAHLRVPAVGKKTAIAYLMEKFVRNSAQDTKPNPTNDRDLAVTNQRQQRG